MTQHHWCEPSLDVVLYSQCLVIILLETLWLCIALLMPVNNSPTYVQAKL